MDDDVVRIAASLHLSVATCHSHQFRSCSADVDSLGTHCLNCHSSSSCHCRNSAVNDISKRLLDSSRILSHFEPSGLYNQMAGNQMEHRLYHGRKGRF